MSLYVDYDANTMFFYDSEQSSALTGQPFYSSFIQIDSLQQAVLNLFYLLSANIDLKVTEKHTVD